MKKIKTDKSTQSICNTLAYHDIDILEKNAAAANKQIAKKGKTAIFRFDNIDMMITIPTYYVPKRNNSLGKIFAYVLSEIPFDAEGKPKTNEITIPIKAFVKDGLYAQKSNALRGLEMAGEVLRHIDIEITKQNRYNMSEMKGYSYRCDGLFTGFRIDDIKKNLLVHLNIDAPWKLFKNQYINVPDDWFTLSSRSFNLVQNIAIIARRSATTISKQGYIDIDLREIAFWLGLPNDKNYNQGKRDIKEPIQSAVDEANSIYSDFIIEKHYEMERHTTDFLNKGFIRVFVDGLTKAEIEIIARKRLSVSHATAL